MPTCGEVALQPPGRTVPQQLIHCAVPAAGTAEAQRVCTGALHMHMRVQPAAHRATTRSLPKLDRVTAESTNAPVATTAAPGGTGCPCGRNASSPAAAAAPAAALLPLAAGSSSTEPDMEAVKADVAGAAAGAAAAAVMWWADGASARRLGGRRAGAARCSRQAQLASSRTSTLGPIIAAWMAARREEMQPPNSVSTKLCPFCPPIAVAAAAAAAGQHADGQGAIGLGPGPSQQGCRKAAWALPGGPARVPRLRSPQ